MAGRTSTIVTSFISEQRRARSQQSTGPCVVFEPGFLGVYYRGGLAQLWVIIRSFPGRTGMWEKAINGVLDLFEARPCPPMFFI